MHESEVTPEFSSRRVRTNATVLPSNDSNTFVARAAQLARRRAEGDPAIHEILGQSGSANELRMPYANTFWILGVARSYEHSCKYSGDSRGFAATEGQNRRRLLFAQHTNDIIGRVPFRGIVLPRDPAATAANVLAQEATFRLGFAFEVISTTCSIVVAALFYELLKPVNSSVSLIAAFFRIVACAVAVLGYVFQLAPLQILGRAPLLSGLRLEESQAIALLLHRLHGPASDIVIVFFGLDRSDVCAAFRTAK